MADKEVNIPASGTFSEPPPDAPRESIQPLSADLIADQLARAAANERTLAPFNPQGGPIQPPTPPQPRETSASVDLNAAAKALADARRAARTDVAQPAASNSDSPSRGVPRPILDPGKTITGGFGSVGEAQYFAITGEELKEIARAMLDQLNARIENDLRFSMALTYPRLIAKLTFEFSGWAQDKSEEVVVVKTHDKTPLEVATEYADEVCFVMRETKREFDEAGNAEDPPDRMRDALGLPKPQKQTVQTGAGRMLVDVVPLPGDTF